MLLTTRTRRTPAAPGPVHSLPLHPAHLPPGYTTAPAPVPSAPEPRVRQPAPAAAPAHPPTSGVLAEVTTECGCTATIHRAGYDVHSPRGEYTVHGYAWRCPGCAHVTTGYLPHDGFGRALRDAGAHTCEVHP